MDTNQQNNTHINTFTSGMNTDTSDMVIKSDSYRYAENIRIITDKDSNSGELRLIEGTKSIGIEFSKNNYSGLDILSLDSIRNIGVLVARVKDDDVTYAKWSVFKFEEKVNPQTGRITLDEIAGPFDEQIWRAEDLIDKENPASKLKCKPISTVLRWESDDNVKLYIADGIHNIIVISITDEDSNQDLSFNAEQQLLPPIVATITDNDGYIPGPIVQYAYRLYTQNKAASDISVLSNPVTGYRNSYQGFDFHSYINKSIQLDIDTSITDGGFKIQIFRISYIKQGQEPMIQLIYDDDAQDLHQLIDSGQKIEDISYNEFLDYLSFGVIPREIESKNDYLFYGNVKYSTDEIDKKFEDFDARCFSDGNYYYNGSQKVTKIYRRGTCTYVRDRRHDRTINEIQYYCFKSTNIEPSDGVVVKYLFTTTEQLSMDMNLYEIINNGGYFKAILYINGQITDIQNTQFSYKEPNDNFPDHNIMHEELSSNIKEYNIDNWKTDVSYAIKNGVYYYYNGYGKCLAWKYTYKTTYDCDIFQTKPTGRTYRRGDVYRFGIILYDENGNKSSVKWIADIKMPPSEYNSSEYNIYYTSIFNNQYTDDTLDSNKWKQADIGVEFVPINTTGENSPWKNVKAYQIVQCKRTINDKYTLLQGIVGYPIQISNQATGERLFHPGFLTTCMQKFYINELNNPEDPDDNSRKSTVFAETNSSISLFVCPEFCMQPDDIKDLIKNVGIDNLKYKFVRTFCPAGRYGGEQTSIPVVYSPFITNSSFVENPRACWPYAVEPTLNTRRDGIDYINQFAFTNRLTALNLCSQAWDTEFSYNNYAVVIPRGDTGEDYYSGRVYEKDLNDIEYITSPEPNSFGGKDMTSYQQLTAFSNHHYCNWHCPAYTLVGDNENTTSNVQHMYDRLSLDSIAKDNRKNYTGLVKGINGIFHYTPFSCGTGGSLMLIKTDTTKEKITDLSVASLPYIQIRNIVNKNVLPYGGYNDTAIQNSTYIETGCYVEKVDGLNPFTSVSCFCGDCFYKPFIYNATHYWFDNQLHLNTLAITYAVPLETEIDISGQFSDYYGIRTIGFYYKINNSNVVCTYVRQLNYDETINNTYYYCFRLVKTSEEYQNAEDYLYTTTLDLFNTTYTYTIQNQQAELYTEGEITDKFYQGGAPYRIERQDIASHVNDYTQDKDYYMYNTAYSVQPDVITAFSEDDNTPDNNYDMRVHFSNPKTNGEEIDSWLKTNPADFIDVDGRYGEITALKLFKDKLLFWQNHSVGVLSVNDRVLLKDEEDGQISLGNGQVLQRFDYISTIYGLKPKCKPIANTDTAIYWWDGYQKEILNYTDGYSLTPLSTIKNIKSYINSHEESSIPSVIYDNKYKEVLFNVTNNETVAYNEQVGAFTSIYTFSPIFYCKLDNSMLISGDEIGNNIYKYNELEVENDIYHSKLFGNSALPKVQFVVNKDSVVNKVYDNQFFNGKFQNDLSDITLTYNTPLEQQGIKTMDKATNRELDYKIAVPRNGNVNYGERLRGKTMQCTIESSSNNPNFSLQYVITKYRISWT